MSKDHFPEEHYLKASLLTSQAFDRNVLYISTGALTISLFFIKDINYPLSKYSLIFSDFILHIFLVYNCHIFMVLA